jgi:hypothetical protein
MHWGDYSGATRIRLGAAIPVPERLVSKCAGKLFVFYRSAVQCTNGLDERVPFLVYLQGGATAFADTSSTSRHYQCPSNHGEPSCRLKNAVTR